VRCATLIVVDGAITIGYLRVTGLTLSGTNVLKTTGIPTAGSIIAKICKIYKLPRAA